MSTHKPNHPIFAPFLRPSHRASLTAICAILLFVSLLAGSCSKTPNLSQKNTVAVSIEPLRYFAEQIAGDRLQIFSIVPKGFSPESYEPSPDQLIKVSDARAYIKVGGLGFETTWLDKIRQNEPQLPIFAVSDSLETGSSGIRVSKFDPHTWTSPATAEIICQSICRAFCAIDSSGAPVYNRNLQKLIRHIRSVDSQVHKILENLPSRTFVIAHPALSYFASQYGLTQLSLEHDGKSPDPQDLRQLIRTCRSEHVHVVLVQEEFNRQMAATLAHEIDARIVTINPLSYRWDKEMIRIAKAIKDGE